MPTVDLNADLGEGYGTWSCGDDDAMLSIVSSANVACGMHAGDPEIMARTFATAKQKGVAVGAHPGLPDLWGFGRRRIPFTAGEVERLVAYQIGAAQALASYAGYRITHVKAHGALGNWTEAERPIADAVARAIKAVDPGLTYLTIAVSEQVKAGEAAGLRTVSEVFADRGYTEKGGLVPRGQPGAMIHDPDEAADRVLAMVQESALITVSGARISAPVESICVHGDSAHAVSVAGTVRQRLTDAGLEVAPFAAN